MNSMIFYNKETPLFSTYNRQKAFAFAAGAQQPHGSDQEHKESHDNESDPEVCNNVTEGDARDGNLVQDRLDFSCHEIDVRL